MKLIMAVSKEGYATRTADDNMLWTGPTDKAVFRALTCVGGDLACGSKTWDSMPRRLPGRNLIKLSRSPVVIGTNETPVRSDEAFDGDKHVVHDLAWFNRVSPNGWLIGGHTIATEALKLDLVDQAFICESTRFCYPKDDGTQFMLGVTQLRESYTRHDPPWEKSTTIKFGGEIELVVWNRKR